MSDQSKPVWFPGWAEQLQQLRLPPIIRQRYRLAVIRYLQFCKQSRQPATIDSAVQFLKRTEETRLLGQTQFAHWKNALHWFFVEGRKQPVGLDRRARRVVEAERTARRSVPTHDPATDVPPPASADLGKAEWEAKLIRVLRSRHYQWRTEQTYRQWAWRFAGWLEKRSRGAEAAPTLEAATAADVREFLTDLATRSRVSASTQKQALNALVFLIREGLERDPGEFGDYARARPSLRIPVVLSREECRRLFDALDGTSRLMAELMYGRVKGFAA